MERIFERTSATLTVTFQIDGVPTDPAPNTATVAVVRADGTVVLAEAAAVELAGTGVFGVQLPPESVLRGDLVATWKATLAGFVQTVETRAEVVTFAADEVREQLAAMCAAGTEPTLTDDELWDLVRRARRRDVDGLYPYDGGWAESYDLNFAAAEGWRQKAGKATPLYTFAVDNQRSEQGQIYQFCLRQAQEYASKIVTAIPLGTERERFGEVVGN